MAEVPAVMAAASPAGGVTVVYDGECPFCSRYVAMLRLRDAFGAVSLVDARSEAAAAREARALFDLDEGMAARIGGRWYHGAECMNVLALASGPSTLLNRLSARVFSSPRRAALLYPLLRTGRNAVLLLLGRSRIERSVTAERSPEARQTEPGAGVER